MLVAKLSELVKLIFSNSIIANYLYSKSLHTYGFHEEENFEFW